MENKLISIIFAAGRGTRLIPLTDVTPKPLLEAGGKSLIEWNMQRVAGRVDKFVIVIGYLGQQIIDKFGYEYMGKPVEYAWQKNPKGGNLDSLRSAIFTTNSENQEANFIIQHCDDIHGKDTFSNLFKAFGDKPDQAYLSAKVVDDREKLKSFGVFRVSEENYFKEVVEKPQEFVSNLVNIAVSYFPNEVINFVPKEENLFEKEWFITDMFNNYGQKFPILVLPTTADWLPVTSITDLENLRKANLN